jgi:hypothetical protein
MRKDNVVVEQVSTKEVKTKFGMKETFSFKADGDWFSSGFKKHGLSKGLVVSFDYTPDTYGNQVDLDSITTSAASAPVHITSAPQRSNKGTFPIDPLDGQRSIVRQNALTNARELYVAMTMRTPVSPGNLGDDAETIMRIARIFEGYTAGDDDLENAKASIAKEAA